ncbi:MAG: gliding motility-associated C-terminal domain-containing protein [Flavobacteriales bacterium]|nr:gliding motility-associated C-terminal domain-containing protein [Flavobacteriales bacterium]MBK7942927.1 gliding motility-associated C-terminal domain-containing protein [Flavobacteriales bacterium]MBK9698673.1 gliding motility-associated C-terminal domain-containing protein [Flavobacteriales bacterium]
MARALFVVSLICATSALRATHFLGGDIGHQCLGGGLYAITLHLYRDCAGATVGALQTVNAQSACGTMSVPLNQTSFQQVTPPCALGNNACNGGQFPGTEEYVFTGTVQLPGTCSMWTLSWEACCRNNAITNLQNPGTLSLHVESEIHQANTVCNTSVGFSADPAPYVCAGQPVHYNMGAFDADGDSLAFAFVAAEQGASTPVPYLPPATSGVPITGMTLDAVTGQISFTPASTGSFVVAIQVSEYNAIGQVVGVTVRDFEFIVVACSNQVPSLPVAADMDLGPAIAQGGASLAVCHGDLLDLSIPFSDPDASDALTLTSNVAQVLPGSTFTQAGTNPAVAAIHWSPLPGMTGTYTFIIASTDDGCPVPSASTITLTIIVNDAIAVSLSPDTAICEEGTAVLSALGNGGTGSITYAWNHGPTIAGPINVQPTVSTYFALTVSDMLGCWITDSVHVVVHPLPDVLVTVQDTMRCGPGELVFTNATPPDMVGSTALWDLGDGTLAVNELHMLSHFYDLVSCFDVNLMVISPQNCAADSTFEDLVCVRPLPEPAFAFGPQPTDVLWPRILFEDRTVATTPWLAWYWSFGNGDSLGWSQEQHPEFTFPDAAPGIYPVTLTVTNAYGCSASVMHPVVIDGVTQVFVPNSFTPDGDGLNDVFMAVAEGLDPERFQLDIFDRWGSVLFSTNDALVGWNGRHMNAGGELPTGPYAWRMVYHSDHTAGATEMNGLVTLLR